MAIPTIRTQTQVVEPTRRNSARTDAMRERADLQLIPNAYQALYDGIRQFGDGVREVGKAVRSIGGKVKGMNADNAMAKIQAQSSGTKPYLKTFRSVW